MSAFWSRLRFFCSLSYCLDLLAAINRSPPLNIPRVWLFWGVQSGVSGGFARMLTGTPAAPFRAILLTLPGPQQGHSVSVLLMLTNGSSLSRFAFSQNPGVLRPPRKHPEDRVAEHPLLGGLLVISGMMTTLGTVTLLHGCCLFFPWMDGSSFLSPPPFLNCVSLGRHFLCLLWTQWGGNR